MTDRAGKRILITGAGGPLGVNVTRSLLAAPAPLFLLGTESNPYHAPLALTARTAIIPRASAGEAYVDALRDLAARERIDLILPTHPLEVQTVSASRERLGDARVSLPAHAAIVTAQSKWETWKLLEAAGLPVPPTYLVETRADLERCFAEIPSRPIWLRGAGTPGTGIGVASLPCREVEHAAAWVDHWRGWGGFIASELLPGANLTWLGLFADGELVACQARERLEYVIPHVSPSGVTGAPAVSRTVSRDDVRRAGEAAVRALTAAPHGPFFVDMTEDPHGTPRITEINAGRFGTTIHFYTEAGFNFPWLHVRLAFGDRPDGLPALDPIPPGTWWLRTIDCGPVLVRSGDAPF